MKAREPRADARHREHQRGHADERVTHRRDRPDHAEVLAQAADHVAEERSPPVLEQRHLLGLAPLVDTERELVGVVVRWFAQAVGEHRDEQPGDPHHEEGPTPTERCGDAAADRDTETGTGEAHDLLVREDLAALVRGVVVRQQARRTGFGHGLTEPEQRPQAEQLREVRRGRRDHRDRAPRHHRVSDRARAVPAVGEVAGGHGDEPVDDDERREQQAEPEVVDVERVLDLVRGAPHDVLVDLVEHDHEPEHPHRPRSDPAADGRRGRRRARCGSRDRLVGRGHGGQVCHQE